MERTATIDLKGKEYAQVKDRVQEFRKANPNGLIETTPEIQADGQILFKARVLKDKREESSAEAVGHALGTNKGEKAFEKLETIAVGRALAYLGYGADGAIASSEEMEDFEDYKKTKYEEAILAIRESLEDSETLPQLAKVWASIPMTEAKKECEAYKNELKIRLTSSIKAKNV